jgi:hypothetical protein
MTLRGLVVLTGVLALAGWQANAQQAASSTETEVATAQQSAGTTTAAPVASATAATTAQAATAPADKKEKHKSKKEEYTGPNTIVELPASPMLDEQGMQRLDPDGKPMWNAPVKQQRDKHGHPLFDDKGKPVFQTASDMGYDEHGKKIKVKKEKAPKMIPVSIARGTMTVDGMTGKAALNYEIPDMKYIYLYAPGIGVAVVSNEPFTGATEQKNAFMDNTLTVTVGEHTLQLASEKRLLGKKPEPAYVLVDRGFKLPSMFPVMGYGTVTKPPYVWPGAKPNARESDIADDAPPPPSDLLPVQLMSPCPSGQMRRAAPPVLPGQAAPAQPCVPIKSATVAPPTQAASAKTETVAPETAKIQPTQ